MFVVVFVVTLLNIFIHQKEPVATKKPKKY